MKAGTFVRGALLLILAWGSLMLLGWGVGEVVKAAGWSGDQAIVDALRLSSATAAAAVTRAVTFLGSSLFLTPLVIVLVLVLLMRGRGGLALFLALCALGALELSMVIKLLVDRPRPVGEHLARVGDNSWPSGHATAAAGVYLGIAVVAGELWPARRRGAWIVAAAIVAAVACSRVLLGVHFVTDVIAGIVLGGLWVTAVRRVVLGPRRSGDLSAR